MTDGDTWYGKKQSREGEWKCRRMYSSGGGELSLSSLRW